MRAVNPSCVRSDVNNVPNNPFLFDGSNKPSRLQYLCKVVMHDLITHDKSENNNVTNTGM